VWSMWSEEVGSYGTSCIWWLTGYTLSSALWKQSYLYLHCTFLHSTNTNTNYPAGVSTENAAFKLANSVLKSINQNMHVRGIVCDLAKASDCVIHETVLVKLHLYGIQGISANWFRSYLANRKQKIEIKSYNATLNFFSHWGILKHEVPQGSRAFTVHKIQGCISPGRNHNVCRWHLRHNF
jgi:hypothetical protein